MLAVFRPYKYTSGFQSYEKFSDHLQKHGLQLGITTELEFARWTDAFCGGPRGPTVDEHVRSDDGSTVRFDNATNVCGILHPSGFIGSCFPSNRRFYNGQCRR
jgi:hypothetical protein